MTTHSAETPSAAITRAAALLDGVARDSERAADYEVPIRSGQAANALHALVGDSPSQVPFVGDDAASIMAALQSAVTALTSLPPRATSAPVLEALTHARVALARMHRGSADSA